MNCQVHCQHMSEQYNQPRHKLRSCWYNNVTSLSEQFRYVMVKVKVYMIQDKKVYLIPVQTLINYDLKQDIN